jgi:endonuclease/exonuclease/phosphatase family metal-dependent hydrolase
MAVLLSAPSLMAQYPAQVKILTYNIYAGGHGDGPYDDIAAVINEIDPDISGHQEVDSCNPRNPHDVIGWLGEQTNMYDLFAPGWKSWGDGHYGEGLLADSQIISHRLFWVEEPGCEDRGAIEIGITMGGERVRVLTTHLAHEGESYRAHQAEEMVKWIDSGGTADIPMVIMGDFNSRPGADAMSKYEDADFVYVRDENGDIMDNIDHIMYRPENRWKVVEADKPTHYTASDHDPVWAVLELLDPVNNDFKKLVKTVRVKQWVMDYSKSSVNMHYNGAHTLTLLTLQGKSVASFSGIGKESYNVSRNTAPGIYLLKIVTDKECVVKLPVFAN